MIRNMIILLILLISVSCRTVQYVSVPVPYLPDFKCPPIVKPERMTIDPVTMSKLEMAQADEYNLQAALRYRRSLVNHILCVNRNLESIRTEAARMKKELESKTGTKL